MTETHLFQLLEAVNNGADLGILTSVGLQPHQIFDLLGEAVRLKLIQVVDRETKLTELGRTTLGDARMRRKAGGPSSWIAGQTDSIREPADLMAVYLPAKRWRAD